MDNEETKEIKPTKKSSHTLKVKEVDIALNITIKALVVVILLSLFIGGKNLYKQYSHHGPSCATYREFLQSRILSNKKIKGSIISVFPNRIQTQNGSTSCHGTFETKSGKFANWAGRVESIDGGVVGWARLE